MHFKESWMKTLNRQCKFGEENAGEKHVDGRW